MSMIQTISMVDPQQQQQQQQRRFRRGLCNFFSDVNENKVSAKGGSTINIGGNTNDVSGKANGPWLDIAKNQTGRIMQGGTDLILTPVTWITNMMKNWYIKFDFNLNRIFSLSMFFFLGLSISFASLSLCVW